MTQPIYEVKQGNQNIKFNEDDILIESSGIFKKKTKTIKYDEIMTAIIDKNLGFKNLTIQKKKTFEIFIIPVDIDNFIDICNLIENKTGRKIDDRLHILSPKKITEKKVEDITCPKCGSTQFMAGNKRLDGKRALVGGVLAGPLGLAIGALSSKKVVLTCLNCGNNWEVGKKK